MLSGERTTAQVRAVTTAEVLAIGRDRLMSLAETDADLRFIVRTRSEVRVLVPSQMAVLTGE